MWNATKAVHAPHWGQKLATPVFYKDEKMAKFFEHWSHRIGLEVIKMKQTMRRQPGNQAQLAEFKTEI
jgi:hypothetical protein